ncbi:MULTISPECIES: ATP-binding cassette domain-containing protein [Cellulosimicrobium]|uniref:ATP-binding cassette domain-containing protein n=1 Tax=Cellulosimicrobium funkei TaxID=264251 RepID=A0A4Y8QZ64_9MICO|nr:MULTISPECIES: ATP-binding cassette domain-containing protein [Cellulosimicrobium]TFF06623.1 ATP-binding cassette domain-containing protein [Cellulosimicrobium funkei]TGA70715.1 ATP-binding cassette domain-containing protein [Cellulosimicrobium terreum]
MTGPMIAAQGLEKSYGDHAVLRGVDLTVRRGEIFALLGPNGAGKTTTVNILTTLVRPDRGTARVAGADVVHDAARVRETIALTGQYASVDEFQTGRENLVMMGELAHLPRRAVRPRAAALLERFDLTDAADRRVGTYSGGMRRRLDLAISLVADPSVLVLDEPTTGLDPASRAQLWEVVRGLAADGTTVLLTTQYLEEADRLADTIAVLHDGRVAARGTAAELKALVAGDHVRVAFDDRESLAAAVGLAPSIGLARPTADAKDLSLTAPSDDPVRTIRDVLAAADAHALAVVGVSVVRPTLDDVFLALTRKEGAR